MSDYAHDVFISYSHKDRAWVRGELLRRLEGHGLKVCVDYRDFRVGAPSVTEMERAIVASRKTVLVLTPDYVASAWTEFENLMLQTIDPGNRALRLIPLLLKPCDLPLRINYLTHVNFATDDAQDLDLAWERLTAALGATAASTSPEPVPLPQPAHSSNAGGEDLQRALYEVLNNRFSMDDIQDLCFRLGVDWDSLAGDTKPAKARALVQYMSMRDSLPKLRSTIRMLRPDIKNV